MDNIEEIMNMLDWHMPLEVQEKGRRLAMKEKTSLFLQPLTPQHNKNVWNNCATIIVERDDEEITPFLKDLLEWLQDMNWPGAFCVLDRLQEFSDKELLFDAIDVCLKNAKESKNEMWETNLNMLRLKRKRET